MHGERCGIMLLVPAYRLARNLESRTRNTDYRRLAGQFKELPVANNRDEDPEAHGEHVVQRHRHAEVPDCWGLHGGLNLRPAEQRLVCIRLDITGRLSVRVSGRAEVRM